MEDGALVHESWYVCIQMATNNLGEGWASYVACDPLCGQARESACGLAGISDSRLIPDYLVEAAACAYRTYLRYVCPSEVHMRTACEHFIDISSCIRFCDRDPSAVASEIADAVRGETGAKVFVGVGSNLFLAKVAADNDLLDDDGRPLLLDDGTFRREFWFRQPLTSIWGYNPRVVRQLELLGMTDLASVAMADEEMLTREFGAQAEYLVDHAWGLEPCDLQQVHRLKPIGGSITRAIAFQNPVSLLEGQKILVRLVRDAYEELATRRLNPLRLLVYVGSALSYDFASRKLAGLIQGADMLVDAALSVYEELVDSTMCLTRLCVCFSELSLGDDGSDRSRALEEASRMVSMRGARKARSHDWRARQFLLFPVSESYSDMVAKRALSEDEAQGLVH